MSKSKSNAKSKSQIAAIIGIFTALIVVLQMISYFWKIGTFSITLTLVPIVVAGVKYGPKYSTFLGAMFGIVTIVGCITGFDEGGHILFQTNPFYIVILCMSKAILCGLSAGLIGTYLRKKHLKTAVISTALATPIVNTGIFILMAFLLYKDTLYEWGADWAAKNNTDFNITMYIILVIVGINFIIEMALNTVLSPVIYRVLKSIKRFD